MVRDQNITKIGRCHEVMLQIQRLQLQIGLYDVPFHAMGIVLGARWLMLLDEYTAYL